MAKRGPAAAPAAAPALVVPEPFLDRSYYAKWSQTEPGRTLLEEAPSDIAAILTCGKDASSSSIVIVCRGGDVIALENGDWDKVAWRSKILFQNEDDSIYHAAYDAGNDCIYLKISGECTISAVNRQSLQKSPSEQGLRHSIIVSEQQSDGRNFNGIAVDHQRRLLFACCYEDEREDLTIWQLTDGGETPSAALIASINFLSPATSARFEKREIKPYFCAFFMLKKSAQPQKGQQKPGPKVAGDLGNEVYERFAKKLAPPPTTKPGKSLFSGSGDDDIFIVAISDFWNHTIELLVARAKAIDVAIGSSDKKPADIGELFSYVGTVASRDEEDSEKLGSVYAPYEIVFDPAGNLFVADGQNKRFQIFSFDAATPASPMGVAWASIPNISGLRRLAVATNPKTHKPAALALDGWVTILCYECS